jgi:hypothetical protein
LFFCFAFRDLFAMSGLSSKKTVGLAPSPTTGLGIASLPRYDPGRTDAIVPDVLTRSPGARARPATCLCRLWERRWIVAIPHRDSYLPRTPTVIQDVFGLLIRSHIRLMLPQPPQTSVMRTTRKQSQVRTPGFFADSAPLPRSRRLLHPSSHAKEPHRKWRFSIRKAFQITSLKHRSHLPQLTHYQP